MRTGRVHDPPRREFAPDQQALDTDVSLCWRASSILVVPRDFASTAMPAIAQRLVRPLAVTGAQRLPSLPDVPARVELYANPLLEQDAWDGLWLPRGAQRAVVDRLFAANEAVMRLPSIERQFTAQGVAPVISESPAAFSAFIAKENDKWRRVLGLLGLLPA